MRIAVRNESSYRNKRKNCQQLQKIAAVNSDKNNFKPSYRHLTKTMRRINCIMTTAKAKFGMYFTLPLCTARSPDYLCFSPSVFVYSPHIPAAVVAYLQRIRQ